MEGRRMWRIFVDKKAKPSCVYADPTWTNIKVILGSGLYFIWFMICIARRKRWFFSLYYRYATLLWDWNVEERILYLYQVMSRVLLSIDMYTIVYCQFSHGGFLDVIFRDQQRSSHFLFASSSSLSVWYRNQRYQQSSECRYEHLYKCLDDCLLYLLAIRLWCFLVIINCRKSRSSTSSQSWQTVALKKLRSRVICVRR